LTNNRYSYTTIVDRNGFQLAGLPDYSIDDVNVDLVEKWFPFKQILPDDTEGMSSYIFWKTFWGFNYYYREIVTGFIILRVPLKV